MKRYVLVTVSFFVLTALSSLCNEVAAQPYGGYGSRDRYDDYDRDSHYDDRDERRDIERERRELERERDNLEYERRRVEDERREQEQRVVPAAPVREQCPSGFQPSENKCSVEERRRGCKDMRLPGGLGCVKR